MQLLLRRGDVTLARLPNDYVKINYKLRTTLPLCDAKRLQNADFPQWSVSGNRFITVISCTTWSKEYVNAFS
jgi:hypothetical protein